MVTTQDILNAAAALPDADRVQIIEGLLATFTPKPEGDSQSAEPWRQVAVRRAAELDAGTAHTVSWEEVDKEGERRIHERLAR